METKQLLVRKNKYWLSEIAELYFNYQIDYSVYSYGQDSHQVGDGYDLMVLNKQTIPYYVLVLGNPEPHNSLFLPFIEDEEESRLLTSKADFVLFYDIGGEKVHVADLPLLKETIEYQYTKGDWKEYPTVRKLVQSTGIQVELNSEYLKFVNTYKLRQDISEKAKKIYDFRVSRLPLYETKVLPISRVQGYDKYSS